MTQPNRVADAFASRRVNPSESFALLSSGQFLHLFGFATPMTLDELTMPGALDFVKPAGARPGNFIMVFHSIASDAPGTAFLRIDEMNLTVGNAGHVTATVMPVNQPQVNAKQKKVA